MRQLGFLFAALALLPAAAPATEWTGCYVGASGNFNTYNSFWTDINDDWWGGTMESSTREIGFALQTGYNRQFGRIVYGLELDYRPTAMNAHVYWANDVDKSDHISDLITLRARMGAAVGDEGLLYGTVGAAKAQITHQWREFQDPPDSWEGQRNRRLGLAYGLGYEHRFASRFSLRLEYLSVQFPRTRHTNPLNYQAEISDNVDSLGVGLNYHF